jgi:PIN domain nuclease of toxin-antitoxin system
MLAYEDFLYSLKQEAMTYLGDEYQIELKHVLKNNGVILDGLLIRKGTQAVSPSIYLNQYYEQYCEGRDFSEIGEEILGAYEASQEESIQIGLNFKFEYEQIKSSITYRLINYEKNKHLLKKVPHLRILDLAVTFHCIVRNDKDGIGTIRITNEHQHNWEVSVVSLWELASMNTRRLFPAVIRPMEDIVYDLMNRNNLEEENVLEDYNPTQSSNMYVLTNDKGINGATCLLYRDTLEEFSRKLDCDFYILPSSIHEVILVPQVKNETIDFMNAKERLKEMVREINETQVAVEEVLSDTVYEYSVIKGML